VNPFSQFFTSTDYLTIIPAVQLALFGCAILLFDAFEDFLFGGPQHRKRLVFGVLAAEVFAGLGLVKQQMHLGPDGLIPGFGGSVTVDGFAIFFNWIFIIAAVIVLSLLPAAYHALTARRPKPDAPLKQAEPESE